MNKDKFIKWMESRIEESLKYEAKDQKSEVLMLGAVTAMTEVLDQVKKGRFDSN